MKFLVPVVFLSVLISGCDKFEDPKPVNQMQVTDNFHSNPDEEDRSPQLKDAADKSYEAYKDDKSESNKQAAIKSNLEAGIYFMYDAPLPPREKYRPALNFFRRVLLLDPQNHDATINKDKIEEIYKMMGKEIPESEL
ncbi:MAG: hypothetical protein OZ913_06155 [Ignavibacteriaceae bacterium]|jgi:hypothetical protein|nr:MAG: hypothetical protein EDM69_08760 [Chlorobiota bacterium]KXK01819.1 MAG: hypothetical protein UZ04_CHB001002099 [Chlorobi bacterium OLB4]MBV6399332.1 hypothetical protein [Ignavibacteria bacterium]MCC6886776.1 hypothetical protein [Ignavibacteriales bacterium]MCE7953713.1 hypothetical protein [Chlorobi bacterium CHB7]MDL1887648.1 hypothetical protein [Ignavibacteria bacterium CHB1]MEB2329869.1 hypothetical protein [Ignavibacteriaceae bacterium]RIK48155.1 MAG: hypothetical protein DCC6